jgi:hypothetical protein
MHLKSLNPALIPPLFDGSSPRHANKGIGSGQIDPPDCTTFLMMRTTWAPITSAYRHILSTRERSSDHATRFYFHHWGLSALRLFIAINFNQNAPWYSLLEAQRKPNTIGEDLELAFRTCRAPG